MAGKMAGKIMKFMNKGLTKSQPRKIEVVIEIDKTILIDINKNFVLFFVLFRLNNPKINDEFVKT